MKKTKPTPTKAKAPASNFRALFARWVAGEQLAALAAESQPPMKRSKFRRMIIVECGGKAMFKDYRNKGAGGRATPGANLRGVRRTAEARAIDDSNVPMVASMSKRDGWTTRWVWEGYLAKVKLDDGIKAVPWRKCKALVYVAPDGSEYVAALPSEKADLLRVYADPSLETARLRRYTTSSVAKKVDAEAKLIERGKVALERTRARKRAAKAARTTKRAKR